MIGYATYILNIQNLIRLVPFDTYLSWLLLDV